MLIDVDGKPLVAPPAPDLEVAEIELDALNPMSATPIHVYLYFMVNEGYVSTNLSELLAQNKEKLCNATAIRESQRFLNRAAADAHVKIKSTDNWNKVDIYWWPPQIIGDVA